MSVEPLEVFEIVRGALSQERISKRYSGSVDMFHLTEETGDLLHAGRTRNPLFLIGREGPREALLQRQTVSHVTHQRC